MPKKILVVDDESDLLRMFDAALRRRGYDVVTARDGLTAVSVAREHNPDLAILDIGLPAGDGFTVMERMANIPELSLIPTIIITASGDPRAVTIAEQAGATAFFQKPLDMETLLKFVDELMGEAQMALRSEEPLAGNEIQASVEG